MLRLPKSVDYGILILLTLYEADQAETLSALQVARACGLPHQQVAKLLKLLQRRDAVESIRGPRGGYRLKADGAVLSLQQIYDMIEGPLALTECMSDEPCHCRVMENCRLQPYMVAVNQTIEHAFSGITLRQISEKKKPLPPFSDQIGMVV
ncbi:Rrf2 family transcriptional regulator [Sulfidibacter corallicola]|uniref:Rrf2 family transcriptional regulator n=1 Tax=Sulfidibacter corallicola TaxID=2818388 RepID=A0A8A4TXP2_SULCO|nr:Rrf2 family transcriptional regulator [Sulfidibacter corallicola]QTD53958.1 Rrf2 family transcriptional regulator [Sulfidibacter corallicola]